MLDSLVATTIRSTNNQTPSVNVFLQYRAQLMTCFFVGLFEEENPSNSPREPGKPGGNLNYAFVVQDDKAAVFVKQAPDYIKVPGDLRCKGSRGHKGVS